MSRVTARRENSGPEAEQLLEAVVERENMWLTLKQVERNKGAAGVDKINVEQLRAYLREHWLGIKEELMAGDYQPQPVRKVEIPKPGGKGMRMLGIPTVLDRLIQQALHQVLSPLFEPGFSESSYGFRPQRSAQQAVLKAREYVRAGRRWVVDIDLEKFFDRVNHDEKMSRLARRIKDKRVLRLVRRYLQAGMMENGLTTVRREGTPQGGPLSPLLSNILHLAPMEASVYSRETLDAAWARQRAGPQVTDEWTWHLVVASRILCKRSGFCFAGCFHFDFSAAVGAVGTVEKRSLFFHGFHGPVLSLLAHFLVHPRVHFGSRFS